MMNRAVIAALVLVLGGLFSSLAAAETVLKIAYVDRAGDPFYRAGGGYAGIYGTGGATAIAGAELAVKDAKMLARALQLKIELDRHTLAEDQPIEALLAELGQGEAPLAAIVDLPLVDVEKAARTSEIPLFNIRHRTTALRAGTCNMPLFHTIPSNAMLADGLAQYLKAANMMNILVLTGEAPDDLAFSEAFQAAAAKFGLGIVEVRHFVHGNDPRQRDLNNARLLTGGGDYDVVFVADASTEFARSLPYRTYLPRPVVGSAGLVPRAWHPLWERHGAPQLNRRFHKFAKRPMTDEDWAAWVAVKAIIEATSRADGALTGALLKQGLQVELYKGFPGSFRPWDKQLRQAILLATGEAVIALAPVEGVLHQFNTLDTLGLDEPEFTCAP